MTASPYIFGSAYTGCWNRLPVDVSNDPPIAPAKPDGVPQTEQQQSRYLLASCAPSPAGFPPVPIGDYPIWRAMDRDPALVLSRAVITSPIREAEISFEAQEGTPDARVKAVEDAVKTLWPAFIADALESPSMGWKPFETVWDRKDGLTVPIDLKPLMQEMTTWLHRGGVFAGLRNNADGGKVELAPESALYITCGGQNRDPYGTPWHENAREAWWRKLSCIADLAKLRRKASGMQGKIWYPPAADEETSHAGEISARTILNAYMSGHNAIFPNAAGSLNPELAADFRNIKGMAAAGLWAMEMEDFGSIGEDHSAILEEIAACNSDLSRAWHVPERAAQQGTHGTLAEAKAHGDIALAVAQLLFNEICGQFSRQVLDTMLVQNWGESARGTIWVKAAKLRDVFSDGDWKIIDTLLANPATALLVLSQIDIDAVVKRRGIPLNEAMLKLSDAIKQTIEQQNAQKQQQAQAQQVPPEPQNGQRQRMIAAARGVAYLGRVLGDDGHDE